MSYFEVSVLEVVSYVLWKIFDCLNTILARIIFNDVSSSLYYARRFKRNDAISEGKCTLTIEEIVSKQLNILINRCIAIINLAER